MGKSVWRKGDKKSLALKKCSKISTKRTIGWRLDSFNSLWVNEYVTFQEMRWEPFLWDNQQQPFGVAHWVGGTERIRCAVSCQMLLGFLGVLSHSQIRKKCQWVLKRPAAGSLEVWRRVGERAGAGRRSWGVRKGGLVVWLVGWLVWWDWRGFGLLDFGMASTVQGPAGSHQHGGQLGWMFHHLGSQPADKVGSRPGFSSKVWSTFLRWSV